MEYEMIYIYDLFSERIIKVVLM